MRSPTTTTRVNVVTTLIKQAGQDGAGKCSPDQS
jgi:hypothetical protein